ncbi:MAG: peptidoglycan synthetase [Bacteroidales bacterium]|nr:peptidoglycan synthetase [Bacteroidales bacterium]
MNIHFIAIGGSAMHNLAIALHKKGYIISGSDDEIVDPSRQNLSKYGLLPEKEGWDENRIHTDLEAVILGMHARKDNPELIKAQQLGLKIFSYPEFLYEHAKNKTRVVIGGSHGKTTITAMILHVLNHAGLDYDYMVGAKLDGFDIMVKLSDSAPIMIFEGDEYLTSPIDRRPKFHLYKPHIALISGIAWDHINVFPIFDNYIEQFRIFAEMIPDGGSLVYCSLDGEVTKIAANLGPKINLRPYQIPEHTISDGITSIKYSDKITPMEIFGKHNLLNLNGARLICNELGIQDKIFFEAIKSYKGASNRLELVCKNSNSSFFKDFAHSPSKLKATIEAVKDQYPERALVACMELHTFSSLNQKFLSLYKDSMDRADIAILYYNPHTVEMKKLPTLNTTDIKKAFGRSNVRIFTDSDLMIKELTKIRWKEKNLLMMSSGNFNGVDFKELAKMII